MAERRKPEPNKSRWRIPVRDDIKNTQIVEGRCYVVQRWSTGKRLRGHQGLVVSRNVSKRNSVGLHRWPLIVVLPSLVNVTEAARGIKDDDGPFAQQGVRVERVDQEIRKGLDFLSDFSLQYPFRVRLDDRRFDRSFQLQGRFSHEELVFVVFVPTTHCNIVIVVVVIERQRSDSPQIRRGKTQIKTRIVNDLVSFVAVDRPGISKGQSQYFERAQLFDDTGF
mmetsp:Transcript_29498/g.63240  ORF Transcript_29498/g.63240 Transcript_29498/m.63240 type:complete len:223 (+) Transcript_29498:267-935(+)